ncbi:MAG TPA: ABC transporter substrate-binding protein [Bryobacteraceae bacterium]
MAALLAVNGCGSQNRDGNLVRIAVTSRAAVAYLPLYVADPAGCFDREGTRASLDETAGAAKSVEALLGGSVDVAAADYFVLLGAVSRGQPIREFVLLQKVPGFVAIVSPKASLPIHKIEDLKGRTIGVTAPGGGYHRLLNHMLLLHGVKPEEVSVVGVGGGLSLALALERGMVDVGLGAGLTLHYLERRYPDLKFLFDTRTAASTKAALAAEEIAFFILCARADWLKAHPDKARRLAAATQCALTWIQDHTPQRFVSFSRIQLSLRMREQTTSGLPTQKTRCRRTAG